MANKKEVGIALKKWDTVNICVIDVLNDSGIDECEWDYVALPIVIGWLAPINYESWGGIFLGIQLYQNLSTHAIYTIFFL